MAATGFRAQASLARRGALSARPALLSRPLSSLSARQSQPSGREPAEPAADEAGPTKPAVIPFSQLPYQCFQEARKVLALDRQRQLDQIRQVRRELDEVKKEGGEGAAEAAAELEDRLEQLKVRADINDPLVQMRFEDGLGDMNKPVYRYLAEKKWRSYRRKLLVQRIETLEVVPDVLPEIELSVDTAVLFNGSDVAPGAVVPSNESEAPPELTIQSFARGQRTVTIAVVDSDVPDLTSDSFASRCHFLAVNVPLTAAAPAVPLARLEPAQLVHGWLPPFAQDGTPKHRLSVIVLDQPADAVLDAAAVRDKFGRDGFSLRQVAAEHGLVPTGGFVFRTIWDDYTAQVMQRNNIPGSDVVFKRAPPEKMPYKKKDGKRYR